jgi:signal peptidase
VAFGWTPTVVLSGSMAPALRPGDIVITSPLHQSEVTALPLHSVVLAVDPAHHDGRLLLHRVIATRLDGTLLTKGDANAESDSTRVPASHVRGLAQVRIPLIGVPVWRAREGDPLPAIGMLGLIVLLLAVRPRGARTTRRHAVHRDPAAHPGRRVRSPRRRGCDAVAGRHRRPGVGREVFVSSRLKQDTITITPVTDEYGDPVVWQSGPAARAPHHRLAS